MTGVGGRPEVVIEGSDFVDRGWREYGFLYKPGNVSEKLPVVAPHQPRLDWQMWFAALGNYQRNPWFLNLAYRILSGEKEVLQLMGHNPFPDRPPTFLRATLYHYHYTSMDKKDTKYSEDAWWVRSRVGEYLPVITKEEPSFVSYLEQAGIKEAKKKHPDPPPNYLSQFLGLIRRLVGQPDGFYAVCALLFTGLVLSFLDPSVKLGESAES